MMLAQRLILQDTGTHADKMPLRKEVHHRTTMRKEKRGNGPRAYAKQANHHTNPQAMQIQTND